MRGRKPQPKVTAAPGPCPDPPDWLTDDPDSPAMRCWRQFAPPLNALGLLESLDQLAFAMLCDCYGGYLRVREDLAVEELTVAVGDNGTRQQHPLIAVMKSQTKALRELLAEFGMTPQSRTSLTGSTSVKPIDVDARDDLQKLIDQFGALDATPPPPSPKTRARKPTKRTPKKQAHTKQTKRRK